MITREDEREMIRVLTEGGFRYADIRNARFVGDATDEIKILEEKMDEVLRSAGFSDGEIYIFRSIESYGGLDAIERQTAFAAAALTGLLASGEGDFSPKHWQDLGCLDLAEKCYFIAEAMEWGRSNYVIDSHETALKAEKMILSARATTKTSG